MMKQILSNENHRSFSGLKQMISNPDQYDLNFREESNIVQLKWHRNSQQVKNVTGYKKLLINENEELKEDYAKEEVSDFF